jgi:phosphoenolpyruvate carboxylase
VACFGLELLKLDIRQESTRHTEALSAITDYLKLGAIHKNEAQRQAIFISRTQQSSPFIAASTTSEADAAIYSEKYKKS